MAVPTPARSPEQLPCPPVHLCRSPSLQLAPGQAFGGSDPVPVDLLAELASVEDPRSRRGVRHGFVAVLAIGVCGVLAGVRTFTAIAEWAMT